MARSKDRFRNRIAVAMVVVAIVASACFPILSSAYMVRTLTGFLFFLVLAQCFNLVGGSSGYLNLGQGVFVGIGAYGFGVLLKAGLSCWQALFVVALTGFMLGLLASPLLFRLKGETFALVNLAMLYIALLISYRWRGVTGGADGFFLSSGGSLTLAFYGFSMLAAILLAVASMLPGTRLGYEIRVIGHDDFLAESLGIAAFFVKAQVFVFSTTLLSLAGALFMLSEGYIIPTTVFGLQVSLLPVAMAMAGGLGTPYGPFVGTLLIFGIQEWLWVYVGSMEQSFLGILLILTGKREAVKRIVGRKWRRMSTPRTLDPSAP